MNDQTIAKSEELNELEELARKIELLKMKKREKEALLDIKPEEEIKKRRRKVLPVAVKEEEFEQIMKKSSRKYQICFLLAYGSGLRVSEIVSLKKEDFDFKAGSILIRNAKGGKDRIVPLPKGFTERMSVIFPLAYKSKGSGIRALQIAFRRKAIKLGYYREGYKFHSLRHGFATRCISNGIPLHHIKTLLGHSNISTTSVYLEANPKEAIKSYKEKF